MTIILTLTALLTILSFCLKCSFYSWKGALAAAVALGIAVYFALGWLTRQSAGAIAAWTTDGGKMLDAAVCIVLEAVIMTGFCFSRPAGKLRWLLPYPGVLAAASASLLWIQLPLSRPGLDFGSFTLWSAAASAAAAFLLPWLTRLLLPDEESRLESLFIINVFLILSTVAATGAITF